MKQVVMSHFYSVLLFLTLVVPCATQEIPMGKDSPDVIANRADLTTVYQELGGAEYGFSTSAPQPRFPNRLYFASIGTKKTGTRRILVYQPVEAVFKKLDDFLYDEESGGGIYQAEREGDEVRYLSGADRKIRMTRKIAVAPASTPSK